MAIIIALLATALGTGSTIFYFLHKRRNKKRIYGVVLEKCDDNIIYIGYNGKRYPVYVSKRRYPSLDLGKKVAIKPLPTSKETTSIVLD